MRCARALHEDRAQRGPFFLGVPAGLLVGAGAGFGGDEGASEGTTWSALSALGGVGSVDLLSDDGISSPPPRSGDAKLNVLPGVTK